MARKGEGASDRRSEEMIVKYDRYRPHNRSDTWYTGETVNPVTGEVSKPPSMTKQSFVDQCDINNILKQYKTSGMLQHVQANAQKGMYMDLPDGQDFQEALHIVMKAEDAFASLPSKLRSRFGNDPYEFAVFCADPANSKEIIDLGLGTVRPDPNASTGPAEPVRQNPPGGAGGPPCA